MEELMQYVWNYGLWPLTAVKTVDGHRIDIIDRGQLNHNSGPDFFNAKVRVDDQVWAGNIEMHVRASDWHRHGHDDDPAYDNVVLHVVQYDDCAITRRSDGKVIPQITMRCAADFSDRYRAFVHNPQAQLPCAAEIGTFPSIYVTDWVDSLAFERLQRKADDVHRLLDTYNGSLGLTAYVMLARGLGFGTNADAMEQLARTVPLKRLLQHQDNVAVIEAILLGCGGLLHEQAPRDNYEAALVSDYNFYSEKYGLHGLTRPQWRSRLRPTNAPERRVATLAAMIAGGFPFPGNVFSVQNVYEAKALFNYTISPYWTDHINFGQPSQSTPAGFSRSTVDLLIVNVAVPLLYAYGEHVGDPARSECAVEILQSLKPEQNRLVQTFTDAGMKCPDAFTSQAYIQLHKNYCSQRKCLFCRIGHRLLAARVAP